MVCGIYIRWFRNFFLILDIDNEDIISNSDNTSENFGDYNSDIEDNNNGEDTSKSSSSKTLVALFALDRKMLERPNL